MNLEDVLTRAKNGSSVHITIVSNQDNGLASYAIGDLIFHPATDDRLPGGRRLRQPAHMESAAANPPRMYFSNKKLSIDPPPAPGSFGESPRQPFSANATEPLGVSVAPVFDDHQTIRLSITVLSTSATFDMERRGNLFVGVGPPLDPSSPEAVYVLAFTGITDVIP